MGVIGSHVDITSQGGRHQAKPKTGKEGVQFLLESLNADLTGEPYH
jgi:hypothetical protein